MALTSTMYTGLSGLDTNQTRLNVIGNNIANVNTVGFKSSRALFKPQFYVTDAGGGPPDANFGGQNPSQRGLGAVVASIEKNFEAGTLETTGKATDLAVDGDGFFIVKGQEQTYTRDGAFTLNPSNELINSQGQFVQGFGVDGNGKIITGALKNIEIPLGAMTQAKATSKMTFDGNLNADGEVASGATVLNSQAFTSPDGTTAPTAATALTDLRDPSDLAAPLMNVGDKLTAHGTRGGRDAGILTYTVQTGDTLGDLQSFFNQALGIDTSVAAPAGGPTPGTAIGATPGDAAGTSRIIIAGNAGVDNGLSLANGFTSTGAASPFAFAEGKTAAGIPSNPAGESVFTSFEAYDSLGTPLTVNMTAVLESKDDTGQTWRFYATSPDDTDSSTDEYDPAAAPTANGQIVGGGTLKFDTDGKLVSATPSALQITRQDTGALSPLSIDMDFANITSITDTESVMTMTKQDGNKIGTLNNFTVGPSGVITGAFSNGQTQTLGQVAVANFANPAGLIDNGANQYSTGPNSGLPVISAPQQLGAGSVRSGSLEASNVDISAEFINMIVSSTGFSAASRVITTANQLMTELLQTTR